MRLKNLQWCWDTFGKTDPLYAILTNPDKLGNKWEEEQFFKTGIDEINRIMKHIEEFEITILHKKALDFGCGVGRLTQALTGNFEEVYGVDIAPSMIDYARKYNKFDGRCQYFLNEKSDLKLFKSNTFDFVYSSIVLQHMEPRYSKEYIKEFLRVLVPGGLAVFQIPSESKMPAEYHEPDPTVAVMEMYGIKKDEILKLISKHGGKCVKAQDDSSTPDWVSYRYYVIKVRSP